MEEWSLEIQTYTISVQNSPSTWEQLHTLHHVRKKTITTCAEWEHEAKRKHCTYHHPHKTGAIFPSTYLERKIKQIKGTLHNLAFIFYQIAHNCNHKMIILCHMCICRAAAALTAGPAKCGAVPPPCGRSGYCGSRETAQVHFLTEKGSKASLLNVKIHRAILLLLFFLKLHSPPSAEAVTALCEIPITGSACCFSHRPLWELKNLAQ